MLRKCILFKEDDSIAAWASSANDIWGLLKREMSDSELAAERMLVGMTAGFLSREKVTAVGFRPSFSNCHKDFGSTVDSSGAENENRVDPSLKQAPAQPNPRSKSKFSNGGAGGGGPESDIPKESMTMPIKRVREASSTPSTVYQTASIEKDASSSWICSSVIK